jgi:hypothetical protein
MTSNGLIDAYVASGLAPEVVRRWCQRTTPSSEALVALAEAVAKQFVEGRIDFQVASGLFNQLMPLVGFDAAPLRFWKLYVALEDFEVLEEPNQSARLAVARLINGVAS